MRTPESKARSGDELLAELGELIQITEGGRTRSITKLRALIKSLTARAIKGDTRAGSLVLTWWARQVASNPEAPAGSASGGGVAVRQPWPSPVALSAMTMSPQTDSALDRLVTRLEGEEGCHTIILYGSRARGDAGADSDYDVIGFRDRQGPPARETGVRDGALLDVFIYPTERLAEPCADMLHVRGGRALRDPDGQGAAFLARLDEMFAAGPDPLPADEIAARRNWAWKTLDRAARGDVEGHFRRAFLLTMQLENFFLLRNEWYLGSKAALGVLQVEHPAVYAVLERALAPAASLAEIEALVRAVNGPRP